MADLAKKFQDFAGNRLSSHSPTSTVIGTDNT